MVPLVWLLRIRHSIRFVGHIGFWLAKGEAAGTLDFPCIVAGIELELRNVALVDDRTVARQEQAGVGCFKIQFSIGQ